jgi:hypothetical protein
VRKPPVVAIQFAPRLLWPLYTPPQKLRKRLGTAFVTALHTRASVLHVKLEPFN